eukprot:RCo048362
MTELGLAKICSSDSSDIKGSTLTSLNFFNSAKWSPDGAYVLCGAEDGLLRLYQLPFSLYGCAGDSFEGSGQTPADTPAKLRSVLSLKEGNGLYDFCWHPLMCGPSCSFVAMTSRDTPVHLWDIATGSIRASFCGFDHLDELRAAHSVEFSPGGETLFAGYTNAVRVFDASRPGRQVETINILA